MWSNRPYQNLGQIDRNLHNHTFGDVICSPPIDTILKIDFLLQRVL